MFLATLAILLGAPPLLAGQPADAAIPAGGEFTGVDGFVSALTVDSAEGLQVWSISHHGDIRIAPLSEPKVSCVQVGTGRPCPDKNGGGTFPMYLSTTPGHLDAAGSGDIATAREPQFVTDPSTQHLYYPAVTPTAFPGFPDGSVGVGCVNLYRQDDCGYAPLAGLTNTAGAHNVNGLTGFVQWGDNIYGTTTSGLELCYSITSQSACAGQPYATDVPANDAAAGLGLRDYFGTETVADGRIYITSARPGLVPPTLSCFDPSTTAPCAGWTPQPIGTVAGLADAAFPDLAPDGSVVGVCANDGSLNSTDPTTISCFSTAGTTLTPPPGLATVYPTDHGPVIAMSPTTVTVNGDLRAYFAYSTGDHANEGSTICYDWTTRALCAGFPSPAPHPTVNGARTFDYNYVYDGNRLYGLGDSGYLFTFDPITGT